MEHAYQPLKPGVKYRTFWNPSKGHFVQPGTDYSFCGLGLCPPEDPDFLIESGWDQVAWFVVDERDGNMCKACSSGHLAWLAAQRAKGGALPTSSPVSAAEWEKRMKPLSLLEQRKWSRLVGMFDGILEVEEVDE